LDEVAEVAEALSTRKIWKLKASDFIGGAPAHLKAIEHHGLHNEDAQVLYSIRDISSFTAKNLASLVDKKQFELDLSITRLAGLFFIDQLIDPDGGQRYVISRYGRQALDLIARQGFDGEKELRS
jgi:hypothetical protein